MNIVNQNDFIAEPRNHGSLYHFSKSLEFLENYKRIDRVKHLGLFSFWFGVIGLLVSIDKFFKIPEPLGVIKMFLTFLVLINLLLLKIRRLHDFNCSAWWLLLLFVPFLGAIWGLAIFCISGTEGNNRYGQEIFCEIRYYCCMICTFPAVCILLVLFE